MLLLVTLLVPASRCSDWRLCTFGSDAVYDATFALLGSNASCGSLAMTRALEYRPIDCDPLWSAAVEPVVTRCGTIDGVPCNEA